MIEILLILASAFPPEEADSWCWPPVPEADGYRVRTTWQGGAWWLADVVFAEDCVWESTTYGEGSCCTFVDLETYPDYPMAMLTIDPFNEFGETRDHANVPMPLP